MMRMLTIMIVIDDNDEDTVSDDFHDDHDNNM